MPKIDLMVTIHCIIDDNAKTITSADINELLDDLKDEFVYDGVTETTIELNERISKQHLLFKQKS